MFMDEFMEPKIYNYVNDYIKFENDYIHRVIYKGKLMNNGNMCTGKEVGKLIAMLIRMKNVKRMLELGTCMGYSSIWFATALKDTNGKLISVEHDKQLCNYTAKHLEAAGLKEYSEVIAGDAKEVIKTFDEPFDIIFQDSDKMLYSAMLKDCIEKTKIGGLIIADDTLFDPMEVSTTYGKALDDYNSYVNSNPQLISTIVPIGSGITISLRIK